MQINRLKVKNFRKFPDLELEFDKGINVLVGPNEAGKSTVAEAILEALFADPATQARGFFERVGSWARESDHKTNTSSQDLYLELEIEEQGKKFLLSKDFRNKRVVFRNLATKGETQDFSDIKYALKELTGIPTREIYESTGFIRQSDVAKIETSNDFVSAIQNIASAGDNEGNAQKILLNLKNDLAKMHIGLDRPAKYPGPLKAIQDKISQLERELTEKRQSWEKVKSAATSGKETASKLSAISSRIDLLEQLLDNNKLYEDANRKLGELDKEISKLEERIQELQKLKNKEKALQTELESLSFPKGLSVDDFGKQIIEYEQAKKAIEDEILSLPEKIEKKPEKDEARLPLVLLIFVNIVVVGVFGGVGFYFENSVLYLVGGALVFVLSLLYWFVRIPSASKEGDSDEFSKLRQDLENKKVEIEQNLTRMLSKQGFSSAQDFYTHKAKIAAISENLLEVRAQIKGLLGSDTPEILSKQQVEGIKKKKEIEVTELTDEVKNSKLSSEDYLAKNRELDLLYLDKRRLEEAKTTANVRVKDAEVDSNTIIELEERLEFAQNQQKYLLHREKVVKLTHDALEEAVSETAESAGKIVSDIVEKYLKKLTSGRYENARLTKDLRVEVFSNEKNDWVDPVGVLSQGTVDQIYFLVRLAFVEILTHGKSMPIILDDPFVTFDEKRLVQTRQILDELAGRFQIIMLTHRSEFGGWGRMLKFLQQGE